MKILTRSLLIAAVTLSLCSPSTAHSQPADAGVTVLFQTRPSVVQHEPVLIDLRIQNRTGQEVSLSYMLVDEHNLRIEVTRPDGRSVTLGPFRTETSFGGVTLAHDDVYTNEYVLDERLGILEPGTYRISIAIDELAVHTAGGAVIRPRTSQVTEVTVEPYDEARLRQVCEWLADRALEPTGSGVLRDNAVRALSQVAHPVALPALRRVALASGVGDYYIPGALVRIGTREALDTLQEMAKRQPRSTWPPDLKAITHALETFVLREP